MLGSSFLSLMLPATPQPSIACLCFCYKTSLYNLTSFLPKGLGSVHKYSVLMTIQDEPQHKVKIVMDTFPKVEVLRVLAYASRFLFGPV